jgi:hypothetical protein
MSYPEYTASRKAYPSRGIRRQRDLIHEAFVSPSCVICEETLTRKLYDCGRYETLERFENRKTCGMVADDFGVMRRSKCMKEFFSGKGNPNYKGIMPKCKDCGKKIGYKKGGVASERCYKCYDKHNIETGEYERRAKENLEKYNFKKGHKSLNPFKKGHKTWIKGKTYEEVYSKEKSERLKKKLSNEMKKKIASGSCARTKDKVSIRCEVCKKEILVLPHKVKTQKVCSLNCAGIKGGSTPKINTKNPSGTGVAV